jgi:carboxymethylenebutenolidase
MGAIAHCSLLVAGLLTAAGAVAEVRVERATVRTPQADVPVEIAIPAGKGPFPPVLYVHARRGYEDPDREHIRTLAGQGFLVVAPDWQSGRFLERWPKPHDPATESDVEAALDLLLKRPEACRGPAGIVGYSRGGYYALRLAAKRPGDVAAIATYAGHMQDPNAVEADQLYSVAPEVMRITAPVLFLVGDQDFELRRMNIGRAFYSLYERGVAVELQTYPMARRAFDFRADASPEEKIAARHARERARGWLARWVCPPKPR